MNSEPLTSQEGGGQVRLTSAFLAKAELDRRQEWSSPSQPARADRRFRTTEKGIVRDLSQRRALTSDKELSAQKYERSVLVFPYHCYAEGLEFEHAAHRRARYHFTSSLHQ